MIISTGSTQSFKCESYLFNKNKLIIKELGVFIEFEPTKDGVQFVQELTNGFRFIFKSVKK